MAGANEQISMRLMRVGGPWMRLSHWS